jgi:hypothetical protein
MKLAAAGLLLLAVLFGVMPWFVGHQVERELRTLGEALVEQDEVHVIRFDYQRRFFSGLLEYDLAFLPVGQDPGIAALRAAGLLPDDGVRMSGTMTMRHGPWTGSRTRFALASSHGDIALPEPLRVFLPQYPGQAPLLKLDALVTLRGHLELRVELIDYSGRILPPESDARVDLDLAGMRARLRASTELDRVDASLELDRLVLGVQEAGEHVEFHLAGLAAVIDMLEERPRVWTGANRVALQHAEVRLPDRRFSLAALLADSEAWIEADGFHSRSTLAIDGVSMDPHQPVGGTVTVSLRNLDVDTVARLAAWAERAEPLPGETQPLMAEFLDLLEQLLSGGPSVGIDELRLSLSAPDDVTGRFSLGLAPGTPVALEAIEELARALRGAIELQVRTGALRQVAAFMVDDDLPGDTGAPEREAQIDALYAEYLMTLQFLPFIERHDDVLSFAATIRDGSLWIGDEAVMEISGLLAMALAGALAGLEAQRAAPEPERTGRLDPRAEPLYGRVELAPDFLPDPYPVELLAGGGDDLGELVGEGCVGWVNAAQPDVVLRYSAGDYPLYIYATAESDTTLAVMAPSGRWHCNDDAYGMGADPGLELVGPESGDYAIWVGAWERELVEAVLLFSEVGMAE